MTTPTEKEPAEVSTMTSLARPSLVDRATHFLLKVCRIDCTVEEVRQGLYEQKAPHLDREKAEVGGVKEALALSTRLDQNEQARRAMIQDKAKWLFTLAAGLLTLFTGILARRPAWFGVLGTILVALPLLFATLLLLRFFGIERRSSAVVDAALLGAKEEKAAQLEALEGQLAATAYNSGATDFLVDLYRASRRLAAIALTGLVLLGLLTVVVPAGNSIVEEVRGNSDLIAILRGPEGPRGTPGVEGPRGPTGERGADGACSCALSDAGVPGP